MPIAHIIAYWQDMADYWRNESDATHAPQFAASSLIYVKRLEREVLAAEINQLLKRYA